MNKNYNVKYLKEIKKTIEEKMQLVKSPNDLLESKQVYSDEVLKIYQEAFQSIIKNSVTFSSLLSEIKNAYESALNIKDERISLLITQDKIFGISVNRKQREEEINVLANENAKLKNLNIKMNLEKARLKNEIGKV